MHGRHSSINLSIEYAPSDFPAHSNSVTPLGASWLLTPQSSAANNGSSPLPPTPARIPAVSAKPDPITPPAATWASRQPSPVHTASHPPLPSPHQARLSVMLTGGANMPFVAGEDGTVMCEVRLEATGVETIFARSVPTARSRNPVRLLIRFIVPARSRGRAAMLK